MYGLLSRIVNVVCDVDEAVRPYRLVLFRKVLNQRYKIFRLHVETVFSPDPMIENGAGRAENAGYDAFLPLVDSGISAYFWTGPKFFSVVIYTCKGFDPEAGLSFTRQTLGAGEMVEAGF